ncbi:MAG TPA: hypothetical protein VN495_02520 [Candidatus Paceibacterota bacterium]|nr:hypothetical protein [Candidatus Paceibacterota bacterium]
MAIAVVPTKIRKGGFWYRRAYADVPEEKRPQEQAEVNICTFVRKAVRNLLIDAVICFAIAVCAVFVASVASFFLYELFFEFIPSWIAGLTNPATWQWVSSAVQDGHRIRTFFLGIAVGLMILSAVIVLMVLFGYWLRSETRTLLHEYVRAKKQRFCPMVKIV